MHVSGLCVLLRLCLGCVVTTSTSAADRKLKPARTQAIEQGGAHGHSRCDEAGAHGK
jgi:hypothetical protein